MQSSRRMFVALAAVLLAAILLVTGSADGQADRSNSSGPVREAPYPSNHLPWSTSSAPRGTDPELAKLVDQEAGSEQEAASLVDAYARTEDEGQRGKLKARLLAALEKQFDLQQKRRDLELARAEAQVKKVRELLRKRADSRQTIIDKRLEQLLREADGLGWTSPPGVRLHSTRAGSIGSPDTLSVTPQAK